MKETLEAVMTAFVAGTLGAAEAERRIVALGHRPSEAKEFLFVAAGGGDVIVVKDGIERFWRSGKTRDEVARALAT